MPGVRVFESSRVGFHFSYEVHARAAWHGGPVLVILRPAPTRTRVNIAIRVVPPVRKMRRGL